jgi:hypothetical protein
MEKKPIAEEKSIPSAGTTWYEKSQFFVNKRWDMGVNRTG